MTHIKSKTRADSERKYHEARLVAMAAVEPEVQGITGLDVKLRHIDWAALDRANAWRSAYSDAGRLAHVPAWDWHKEARRFRRRTRRVELAIWVGDILCGLALGRISDSRIVATIHLLESSPVRNPLSGRVIPIASRFLEVLAISVGCREVAIDSPVLALVDRYRAVGFIKEITKGRRIVRLAKSLVI